MQPETLNMAGKQVAALVVLALLLAIGWVLLAAFEPDGPGPMEYPTIGYFLGTPFGWTTLAAAWVALGPLRLGWRLALSLAWLGATLLALMLNMFWHGGGPPDDFLVVMAACIAGQWVLVQLFFWPLALWYGLRIRPANSPPQPLVRQFAIRQLMILTAIVAIVLGVGRATVPWLLEFFGNRNGDPLIIALLAVAGIILTVPLVLAALLPRWAVLASAVVVVLIGLATAGELSLFQMLPSLGGGPDFWHFAWINGFSTAWVLAVIGLVRLAGFGIVDAAPAANLPANSR